MENPRKKLYSSLVTSADPDVKKHFSQWSADEFDKKLAEDKEFQKDLFLDLRDIGMAKDEATFAKQYFGQPAPTPAAPATNAAPVVKPTEATKEAKTIGALSALDVVTEGGPMGVVKNLAKAVGKGIAGIGTAAKQFIGLKSEDEKYEEAQKKSQAGSVSGFADGEDLSVLGRYENAANEFKKAERQKENIEKLGERRIDEAKPMIERIKEMDLSKAFEYKNPKQLTQEEQKAYQKSRKTFYKSLEEASSVLSETVSKIAKDAEADKTAYVKDRYGISVPNPEWVAKKAREVAMTGGGSKGGYAETFLKTKIIAALTDNEIKEERDQVEKSLNNGKTIQEAVGEDFAKGVEPFSTYQNRYKLAVKAAEKIAKAEYSPKVEAVTNEYKSALETYKKNVASDPSIRQAVDEYDAQNIARLQEGVNKGVLTVEQANAMLTGKDSMDARNAYINKIVDEKHGKPLNEAYNKYLSNVSVLNNRYNARMRRQDAEEKKYQELQYKKLIETAKKNYNIPQHIIDKYQKIREQANDIVYKRRGLKRAKGDINASIWDNFVSSTLKGLGEGIQSTAYTLGLEDVASFGDLLAKNFETSDLTINSWNDIGFGREGLTKFANSAGSIFGRMGPGMAGSAAVAAATGGAGLGFLPSLFLTSVPSAAFETADIMGSIEQQVLAQGGDIAAAKKASERALKSQIMQFPLYTFDALPFFPKFLKFAGKGKYAALNIAKRAGAGFGINVLTETMQEVPQNLVEEIILEGKDPTFKELVERSTWEKWQNTSASVASLGLLMGAGPQIVDSSKDAIAKRAAAGYFANNILGQASHPALQAQNQTQFLTQLADEKGERFAAQMVNVLFQKGNIDKVKAEALANKLANFQNFKQTTLGQSENPIVRQAGFILFDKYMEAKNSKNEQAQESALAALNDYARTGNAELVMLRMPDGSFKVYNYDDLNSLMDDEDFQQASRESNDKYGAVFEITPLAQTREGLENPKLQQIIQRFDDIRKAAPEAAKTEAEDTTEVEPIDDAKILEGQKRSGFEVPKLFDIIPVEAAAVVDAVRSREPGVTPDELSGASNAIYQIHKMYEKMRSSTTRNLTLEQIDNITDELEQAITDLENQKTRLAIGDEQMDSLQQQDTESNQTIDTVTAPVEQAPQVAPVAAPTVEAEAPAAPQSAPEAAQAEAPAPAKPKAKVNVFTDEDVIDSFSQKESDIYDRLLFDGDEDLANQMIQDKRNELVKKEVELLDVGRISEKVRQSFARAGIDVELLSADEFVQKLKEAGESASRTTEGVFDDNRGKIFINKDALQLGYGTTVVWHEAIHPIMNIIHNSNKALYDKIHKGILANAKANPEGQMAKVIEWVNDRYTRPGDTDATRKDEIIVEALARLASGRMSFSELQPTLRQQFIDLINRIGRILGLSKAEVSDMKAIKDLAKKITETIKEGRDLSEIVGAENIGKYQREESDKVQSRLSATENPVYFKNIAEFASRSTFNNKLEFKKEIQQALESYIPELKKIYGRSFDPKKYNELTKRYLTDILVREAVDAITKHPEAIGWYDEKTRAALAIIELMHPEIATDEEAKGAFILALAVMSNGNLVDANFDLAEKQYRNYKETGRFDTEGGYGNQQDAIIKSLKFINHLLDNNVTMIDLNEFFTTIYKVKDLKVKMDKETIDLAGGENADQSVFGAIVLGPKIGNGFYMNLWGEFGQLTMDRWFMRTWGRMTGTLIEIDKELISKNKKRVSDAISAIKESKEARALLKKHIPSISGMNSVDIAKKVNKLSINKAIRNELTENDLTNELRKASNNLVKNISGEKEAPGSGGERIFIREVFKDVLQELEKNHNIEITMADLQAVLWYPEKILYESFKKGKSYEEVSETYNDEEAPDYQNAAKKLALKSGIDASRINEAIERERKRSGSAQQSAVEGAREANSDFNKGIVSKIKEAAIERKRIEKVEKAEKKKAKKQASLGGRGEFVNTPLGVGKGLKNVASQNEDVITTKISVAPFYSVKVKSIDEANAVLSTSAFIRYKKDIEDIAKAAGIKIKNIDEGIGGFAFDDGTIVKEATTVLEVTGSWQNIVDFAALSGALTPEVQESTIAGRYVEENTKEHNADEYTVQIDNTEAAFQAAIDAGFDKAGFTLLNDEIRFYNVFKYRIKDIFEKIDTFASKYTEYGGNIKGEAKRPVQSEYIDYDDRANALAKIAADALQPGSNWAGLRDRIDFAQKRNEAFRDWKKVKKSKKAKEYEKLRREQIEAGSRGDVLSDKKLERIKELEKFFETPLTTVVSTDEEKYLEAKAEIDAIANDVAKMVAGGFASPFKIKRPARAAIKVVRWYSLNPNMLGDGSRTNIIVNTNQDADYLFQQIRDRFTIPGDRVEYDMPTGLGYPKRLIEIRTSNGKIAEIQVMTPQGYLAKDGVKDFPDDKQDLAREALGEVQDRLGWKIPDGVGHYFYEIERDTNVQNELRKEAVRVSNLYYEAFLNPDSTLSDSEFRKAVSDFKDRVDSADKSKWDETNKGEAPASLVEYLGGRPQASLGERQAAPSFAELDDILDMPPAKSRAAREKLIDQYGKETVDRMIEISRNFTKIINGLEEQGVVEKDCP